MRDQVRLYSAWVAKDWPAVQRLAKRLLEAQDAGTPPLLQHAFMVYGILASMALGEVGAAQEWDQRYGQQLPKQLPVSTREFLRAWDGHEKVCLAER